MDNRNASMALEIARQTALRHGRAYYVGGFVRDAMLGIETKDIDIEIHGLPFSDVQDILNSLGSCTSIGTSFGIFGLKGYDLDIALPRKERNTGRGHKDFEIFVDPFIGPEKSAVRRDFTMNAIMQDIITGERFDYFGGIADIQNRVIRHISNESFAEDPLRVLRAAQFAARFGFSVAEETVELCRGMDLSALPRERVFGELEKALMKSDHPSVFFRILQEMDQLGQWFPEVQSLFGVAQDPVHHPEGDVWEHTLRVLDHAAAMRSQARNRSGLLFSALCHDFGKITTTAVVNGRIHAYLHEIEGIPLVSSFIRRLTGENALIKYVENMTELHMRPNMLVCQNSSVKSYMKLFDSSVCPEDLLLLSKADYLASCSSESYKKIESALRTQLNYYRELMKKPMVQGADLVAAGIAPGPKFKSALSYARKLHLAGISKETALKQTLGYMRIL